MIKVGNIIRALLGVGIDANKAVEYAEFIETDYNGPGGKGGQAYAVAPLKRPTLKVVPDTKPHVNTDFHKMPLAAHRCDFERMLDLMKHLYEVYERPIEGRELWFEIQKGDSRGGRAQTLAYSTFNNYLSWFSTGRHQANGRIFWKRVGRGKYVPV